MEKIITLDNLTKSYDGKCIIDHISHDFYKGESIAFTGHNGCGKSTLLKLMAGLLRAGSGRVCCSKRLRFAYVPEKFPGMEIRMTDFLSSVARMESRDVSAVEELIHEFFLDPMKQNRLCDLSKGSLQKVGVIQALLTDMDVLLLDEPLSGQDAASQDVFLHKCNELRKKGVTIFMSCHEKKLIDELSDREYSIVRGKLYEIDEERETSFRVFVRKTEKTAPWTDMEDYGNRYLLRVERAALKDVVLKLYGEGWELTGIEEYI